MRSTGWAGFRTIISQPKGSPGYFHHSYRPLSWLASCCLCSCNADRVHRGSFSTDWPIKWCSLHLCLFPWGQEEKWKPLLMLSMFPSHQAFLLQHRKRSSVWNAAEYLWSGLWWVCDEGGSLLSQWALGGLVCVCWWSGAAGAAAGSVSYRLWVWCHG